MYQDGYFLQDDALDDFEKQFRKMKIWLDYGFEKLPIDLNMPNPEESRSYIFKCPCRCRTNLDEMNYFDEFWKQNETVDLPTVQDDEESAEDPIVDIIENDTILSITIEVPSVSENDIELSVGKNEIIIKVNNTENKFYKKIKLESRVDARSAKISYNNGILDIEMKKINE